MPKTESLSRPAFAEIHLERLISNLEYLLKAAKHPFFCPMLKANAYGHGDQQIANLLQDKNISTVGVSTIDEAIHLRQGGYKQEILVFSASFQSCAREVLHYNLTPVISDPSHLEVFKKIDSPVPVHVKLNTGMNRMGIDEDKVLEVVEGCKQQGLQIKGVLTHLHSSSDLSDGDGISKQQMDRFESLQKKYFAPSVVRHVYNSDGLLLAQNANYGARPGIALYGYSEVKDAKLLPVMELKAKLVSVRKVRKNEVVSYSGTWRASEDTTIGVLPLGYADGLPRVLSNVINFRYKGYSVPQVGTICMDYTMVNLEQIKDKVGIGSVITIFGMEKGYTAADAAKKASTISYEMLTSVSERIPRFFIE